jgi:hypothetical protein
LGRTSLWVCLRARRGPGKEKRETKVTRVVIGIATEGRIAIGTIEIVGLPVMRIVTETEVTETAVMEAVIGIEVKVGRVHLATEVAMEIATVTGAEIGGHREIGSKKVMLSASLSPW